MGATGGDEPAARALAAVLGGAGVLHFATPRFFDSIVPRVLGNPRPWTYASGLAELACGAAVLSRRTRPVGALASAGLFVGVFPANVQMALDAASGRGSGPAYHPVLAWGRLPLQVPLVLWALRVARAAQGRGTP